MVVQIENARAQDCIGRPINLFFYNRLVNELFKERVGYEMVLGVNCWLKTDSHHCNIIRLIITVHPLAKVFLEEFSLV